MSATRQKQKTFRSEGGRPLLDDPINRKLLTCLREDARLGYAELGKRVHLSAPAVYERVRRLEAAGVIRQHTILIDAEQVGLPFCAFVRLATTTEGECSQMLDALAALPEIEECHSIAGEDTVLLKVRTTSPPALETLLRQIRRIPGIAKTVTTVVLQTCFERGVHVPDIE